MSNRVSVISRKKPAPKPTGSERRQHRRHDLEGQEIPVDRWDSGHKTDTKFGKIVDLSSSGVRIRTTKGGVKPDNQIRVRLELPNYAGISPFISSGSQSGLSPRNDWVGWMTVSRVVPVGGEYDVAGQLMDMDEVDRGMLGLYLSTQPLAA
ncbi:MAG: PilZ domain-containing protein [Tepidisphaeraceae bacterium]|jgi:hypothetical protein